MLSDLAVAMLQEEHAEHIAKHFHFVKEKRAAGLVVLKYLATARLQVADMFTKQIFPKHFERRVFPTRLFSASS